MTQRIPHRELRNDSARVLREVAAGATYEITNRDVVVAVISPPSPAPAPLVVHPARRTGGFGDLPLVDAPEPTTDAIDALRGDR